MKRPGISYEAFIKWERSEIVEIPKNGKEILERLHKHASKIEDVGAKKLVTDTLDKIEMLCKTKSKGIKC